MLKIRTCGENVRQPFSKARSLTAARRDEQPTCNALILASPNRLILRDEPAAAKAGKRLGLRRGGEAWPREPEAPPVLLFGRVLGVREAEEVRDGVRSAEAPRHLQSLSPPQSSHCPQGRNQTDLNLAARKEG